MDTHGLALIAVGVILFGLVSRKLEGTIITAPMVFAVFGLLIGEAVFGLADLDFGHGFIHGLAEVTLILVLFSDAARIDLRQLRRDHNLPVRMLLIGMPLAIIVGTLVALALPLGLGFWEAALLAAILAPTDAALGQSVVSSPLVPTRIRQALNADTGVGVLAGYRSLHHVRCDGGAWSVCFWIRPRSHRLYQPAASWLPTGEMSGGVFDL